MNHPDLLNALQRYGDSLVAEVERLLAPCATQQDSNGFSAAHINTLRRAAALGMAMQRLHGVGVFACICGVPSQQVDAELIGAERRVRAATADPTSTEPTPAAASGATP